MAHFRSQDRPSVRSPRRLRGSILRGAAGLLLTVALSGFAQQQPQGAQSSSNPAQSEKPNQHPEANRVPGPDIQPQQQTKQQKADAAQRKQIANDAAKLLQLAQQLKAEVDKTDKDTLSLQVIRKADSIEKLAKGVTAKMKQTAGAS